MMLKRLNDKPSCYDKKIWFKDFEKSQAYKKNICIFPSIKFHKETDYEKMPSSPSKVLESSTPYSFNNMRSKTSYQKYKPKNNPFEKLYGSKYFQNPDDTSKSILYFELFFFIFIMHCLNLNKENKQIQFGGITSTNFYKTQIIQNNQNNQNVISLGNNFSQANRAHFLINEKNLIFSKKVLLENFGECYINFHVENSK